MKWPHRPILEKPHKDTISKLPNVETAVYLHVMPVHLEEDQQALMQIP